MITELIKEQLLLQKLDYISEHILNKIVGKSFSLSKSKLDINLGLHMINYAT